MTLASLAAPATLTAALALAACGSPAKPPAPPTPSTSPTGTAQLAWLTGDHALALPAGGQLSFVGHEGATYGVWLGDGGRARVWIFDEVSAADPRPRVWSVRLEPGAPTLVTELTPTQVEPSLALWAAANGGASLSLRRTDAGAIVGAEAGGLMWDASTAAPAEAAGEIAALETLFAKDSQERGGPAWATWFAPDGSELGEDGLVVGNAAVGARMTPMLAAVKLAWAPITTRVRGDVAFAVGGFTVADRASGAVAGGGSYVTVWRKDPTLGWKVWFDGGRPG